MFIYIIVESLQHKTIWFDREMKATDFAFPPNPYSTNDLIAIFWGYLLIRWMAAWVCVRILICRRIIESLGSGLFWFHRSKYNIQYIHKNQWWLLSLLSICKCSWLFWRIKNILIWNKDSNIVFCCRYFYQIYYDYFIC